MWSAPGRAPLRSSFSRSFSQRSGGTAGRLQKRRLLVLRCAALRRWSCGAAYAGGVDPRWPYLVADGLFAACEEAADPALCGRPVGVVARVPCADAQLIAVNTVAKAAGVGSGVRLCEARERYAGFVVRAQRVERALLIAAYAEGEEADLWVVGESRMVSYRKTQRLHDGRLARSIGP